MSTHEIERFWAQVSSNPRLKAALQAALPTSPAAEPLAAFAQKHGFQVTADDVRRHQAEEGELSEEALAAVSGGGDMPPPDPIEPVEDPLQLPPPPEEDPLAPSGGGHIRG